MHTADGGLDFVLEVLERAERHLCGKAAVRFDAGYPGEPLMAALEERGTNYVAPGAQQRRAEAPCAAGSRRRDLRCSEQRGACRRAPELSPPVILPGRVVVAFPPGRAGRRRPGELIPRCFWLLTSMPTGEVSGEDLRATWGS